MGLPEIRTKSALARIVPDSSTKLTAAGGDKKRLSVARIVTVTVLWVCAASMALGAKLNAARRGGLLSRLQPVPRQIDAAAMDEVTNLQSERCKRLLHDRSYTCA
jgi:hypothetical protein